MSNENFKRFATLQHEILYCFDTRFASAFVAFPNLTVGLGILLVVQLPPVLDMLADSLKKMEMLKCRAQHIPAKDLTSK